MIRQDPLRGFRFLVDLGGVTTGIAAGGFSRVKGLSRELKHESYREGGVNEYEHKLVTHVIHPVVVLERGLALPDLWQWALDAAEGSVKRKSIRIFLQDEAGGVAWMWGLDHAFPVKWSASDLDAHASQVVMESLELAHHGLRRLPS